MAQRPPQPRPLCLDILSRSRYGSIDRRQLSRSVPMKVLCLGLSRTGTQSLRQALFELGFDDVYHATSVNVDSPRDAEMWVDAIRAKYENRGESYQKPEWDRLLGHCMAVTDVPAILFWQELLDAYPEAQVILTVREDSWQWYRSFSGSCVALLDKIYGENWLSWIRRRVLGEKAGDVYAQLILKYEPSYRTCQADLKRGTEDGVACYDRHNEAVKAYCAQQGRDVLIFNVTQGWEPLCRFLACDEPESPFPRLNHQSYYSKGSRKLLWLLTGGIGLSVALYATPVMVALYCARWFLT